MLTNETKSGMWRKRCNLRLLCSLIISACQSFNILPFGFPARYAAPICKDYKFDIDTLEAPNTEQREQIPTRL